MRCVKVKFRRQVPERDSTAPEVTRRGTSWTEELLIVECASLFQEQIGEGKISYSIQLELAAEPESSSNQRNRTEMQLVLGLEEKDIPTFARLLGRKVMHIQEREEVSLEREQLLQANRELQFALQESEAKVKYLNDSLHHYVQESRKFQPRELT